MSPTKYPRTYHLPWSNGISCDDKVIDNTNYFNDKRIIITEKMDGENTTLYTNYYHARSIDSRNHISRNWVKSFWSSIKYNIPESFRICGENLFAKHSIGYSDLSSYFLCFSIWENTTCLDWDNTKLWCELLEIPMVPILYDGIFNIDVITQLQSKMDFNKQEGYVIRIADEFDITEFKNNVSKYVRYGHVQTDKHWMNTQLENNLLINR
jgi:hypothetical protein